MSKMLRFTVVLLTTLFLTIKASNNGEEAKLEINQGGVALAKGLLHDALSHFHKAIELEPTNYQALFRRATTYLAMNNPNLAINDLDTILRFKSDFNTARTQRANILFKMGKLEKAAEEFRKLNDLEKLKSVENNQEWLKRIEYNGDCDQILNVISMLIESQPFDESLYLNRAECYKTQSNTQGAIKDLRKVISLRVDSTDIQYELSQVYYNAYDIFESLNVIRECLKYNPDHKKCYEFYKKIRKPIKVLESMKSAIEEQNWGLCVEKGQKLIDTSQETAILQPFLRIQCKCHRHNGNIEKAIEDCTQAIAYNKNDAEAFIERAEAYMDNDEFKMATDDFQQALNIDPDNKDAREGIEQVKRAENGRKKRDYYKILGVKRRATKREITKAYRKLAQKWHPDNFSDEKEKKKAEKKFIDIAAAKEVLSDDEKREQFDNGKDPLDTSNEGNPHHGFHGFHPGNGFFHFW